MNQQKWKKILSAVIMNIAVRFGFAKVNFGQSRVSHLEFGKYFMLLSRPVRSLAIFVCSVIILGVPALVLGQTNYYAPNGTEYPVVGSLASDQVFPDVAVNVSGGFVVWQDNITDGSGWGISASRLDSTLSSSGSSFRVNATGTNDQEHARVALLKNGGAVFTWQGGVEGFQHIYARFVNSSNVFLTSTDVVVSTFTNNFEVKPAVAALNNSNAVIVWSSYNRVGTNSQLDVYGQILSPTGAKIGTNFLINQFTTYNQRTPAVAALKDGGFVVTWVSEQQITVAPNLGNNSSVYYTTNSTVLPSVNIYARLYQSNGMASSSEFLVSTNSSSSANPAVAAASDGSYMIAWSSRDMVTVNNAWDICARSYSNTVGGATSVVNTYLPGSQYAPCLSAIGSDYLAVWTSLGQDGSRDGVYGQHIHSDGSLTGGEFRVNTTTANQQMQPAVASDGVSQFLAVWTSYVGNPYSFDLFAQRYVNADSILQAMPAPFVSAPFTLSNNVYQPQLQVSWAPLAGISVSNYEVYVDGAKTPMGVTASNVWTMTAANGLTTNSTHSFQVDYMKANGAHSPLSDATTASTWSGLNWGGIPYEWMAAYFGGYYNGKYTTNYWQLPNSPLAAGGPTLLQVFVSGGNPLDSSTWLTTQLLNTRQGMFLSWNTQPGKTYQVQVTTNFAAWSNLGVPRFAASTSDSIYVGGSAVGYYRVLLVR